MHIVKSYHISLERYARLLLAHKHRAPDIVKWALESVYEEEKFYEGPHLRPLLIERTRELALGFNRALQLHEEGKLSTIAYGTDPNPVIKPPTSH
ncbi:MAG: hypothetical protein EOP51_11540 [Sphingobacteriales bacterium]|nr:MAG: hypothetical protein EOP51_11540 [Sphingobacteriales bacterium]